MDLTLWNEDFFLPPDVGLDFLDDQNDGQYGDLKQWGRLGGTGKPNQLEEVVEQASILSNDDSLGNMDWMESNMMGSLLDALAGQEEMSLPALYSVTASLPSDSISQFHQALPGDVLNSDMMYSPITQDSMLTPPESPDQVLPVIKLEETGLQDSDLIPASPSNFLFKQEIIQDGFDLGYIALPEEPLNVELQDSVGFIGSPLSADDVEYMLSDHDLESQSPKNNLILSSPELYKVIAAPSNISYRFSPYSKQKTVQKSRSPKRPRAKKGISDIAVAPEVDIDLDVAHLSKKDKKKLQNKNAAIRYRQKKKEEAEIIHVEVDGLEEKNQGLKAKVEDLEREIRYMKNLMHDIQKAKGLQ